MYNVLGVLVYGRKLYLFGCFKLINRDSNWMLIHYFDLKKQQKEKESKLYAKFYLSYSLCFCIIALRSVK